MKQDKCFKAYCREEPSQMVNGRWTCDKHVEKVYDMALMELDKNE